ncbi:Reverse transcriptase-like [Sesbania bispinosa]|nr:Reverse transcriptase-like [Sesbania bispinosa]
MASITMTELWGIFTALQIAWDHRFPQLWLESDSVTAVSLIANGCTESHPCRAIIREIRNFFDLP